MKFPTLLLLISSASVATAQDSSVTVYGIADIALGSVRHSLPASGSLPSTVNPIQAKSGLTAAYANSTTGLFNGGIQDSRFGIRGTENLGDGRSAFFTLESGFNLPTGQLNNAAATLEANGISPNSSSNANSSLNGQLFNRQAFVGLSDKTYGSIAFGRNYNQIYDVVSEYDPVQKSDLFSPFGLSGTFGGGGGISENSRLDGSIKYKNQFGAFNVGGLTKLGGGTGTKRTGTGYVLNLGYTENNFGVQAVYEEFKNTLKGDPGSSALNPVAAKYYNNSAFLLAAKYKKGEATFKSGWERYVLKKPGNPDLSAVDYFGYTLTPTAYTGADAVVNIVFVGGDVNLTPRLNLGAGFYNIRFDKVGAGGSNNEAGDLRWTSMLADYKFSKRTDVYTGLAFADYRGAKFTNAGQPFTKNTVIAIGIRHKF